MNKSKFKTVHFKPMPFYNRYSWEAGTGVFQWTFHVGDCVEGMGHCTFTEEYIEQHPELFEVEKAERNLENRAWYKVKANDNCDYEAAQFYQDCGFMRAGVIGFTTREMFFEIGEKIEL